MKCLTCKKHYTQNGKCREEKKNCFYYDEEPRGKMVRTTFTFKLDSSAKTPIIKYGSKVVFEDNNYEIEMTIIKINWINLETMMCNVDAEYHKNEMPRFEKIKQFKVIG